MSRARVTKLLVNDRMVVVTAIATVVSLVMIYRTREWNAFRSGVVETGATIDLLAPGPDAAGPLRWAAVPGAARYRLDVFDNRLETIFTRSLAEVTYAPTAAERSRITAATAAWWRVDARRADGTVVAASERGTIGEPAANAPEKKKGTGTVSGETVPVPFSGGAFQAPSTAITAALRGALRAPLEVVLLYAFEPADGGDVLVGSIVTAEESAVVRLGGDRPTWRDRVERFRLVLRERGFGWDAADGAQALHARLVAPLLAAVEMPDVTRATIIADPLIRRVPFSALAPKNHPYRTWFGFLTAITYAPDVETMVALAKRPTAPADRPPHIAAFSDSTAGRAAEAQDAIQCGSPISRALDAAAPGFGEAPVEWIHVAAPITPTAVRLAKATDVPLASFPERTDFVVAAHPTGFPDRGDPVAIAAPLLRAGAASVLTTRWALTDQVIQRFLGRFYHHLADGHNRAEALVQTKKEFSRSPGFGGPSTWAAFALVGDPGSATKMGAVWRWYTLWWYVALVASLLLGYRVVSVLAEDSRRRQQASGADATAAP